MIRFCSLASGSSGNAGLIEAGTVRLLVDAGLSAKRLCAALQEQGWDPASLDAILLTHEHADHILGLAAFLKKHPLPVYTSAGTLEALMMSPIGPHLPFALFRTLEPEQRFTIGTLTLQALPVPHDAARTLAFRLQDADGTAFAWVTDLGMADERLAAQLLPLDGIALEANHDLSLLETGPYPYPLKQRISGVSGHLSNDAAAALLCRVRQDRLKEILLVHLSQENNYPPLARMTVEAELLQQGREAEPLPHIQTAPAHSPSEWMLCGTSAKER